MAPAWVFRFVKVACNVAHPKGTTENRLDELLQSWFGRDAGLPGTGFTARFQNSNGGWRVNPVQYITTAQPTVPFNAMSRKEPRQKLLLVESPPAHERFVQYVPVYDLEAAAGFWGPDHTPSEVGWMHHRESTFETGNVRRSDRRALDGTQDSIRSLLSVSGMSGRFARRAHGLGSVPFDERPRRRGKVHRENIPFRQNHDGGGLVTPPDRASPIEPRSNLSANSRD